MDFKAAMTEWVGLKAQLAAARKDLGVLNKREKDLRKVIEVKMKSEDIDVVKVHDKVKVSLRTKKTKGSITKDVILSGLRKFFNGDEAQVEGAWNSIQDSAPVKEVSSVSVSGLKELL